MRRRTDPWRSSKFVAVLAVWTAATAAGLSLLPATAAQAAVPGGVQAWGLNTSGGQLCNGGAANSSTPVAAVAPANANVTAISAGAFHTLAVISGVVFGCGVNRFGQLGNGGVANSAVPVAVAAPAGVVFSAVSAGWDHSLALSTTGTVWSWGNNFWGQLGLGTQGPGDPARLTPFPVNSFPPGTVITAIAAGGYFSLALDSTGQVWAWGNNFMGQLGQPAAGLQVSTPTQAAAPANTGVTAISAGACHSLAVKGGTVLAWGYNGFGQLANVAGGGVPGTVTLPGGVSAIAVAAGGNHSLALTTGGAVLSWGRNNKGQLGDGTNVDRNAPVAAAAPANAGVTAIAAGWQHSLALTSTGGVLAWGWNISGQLGDGTLVDRNAPVALAAPFNAGVSLISAGYAHSVAVQ